jgi:hypothetical protein
VKGALERGVTLDLSVVDALKACAAQLEAKK